MIASVAAFVGVVLLMATWLSVLRTVFIPRQRSSRLMRWVVYAVRSTGAAIAAHLSGPSRERVLELCAPLALMLVGAGWTAAVFTGFALLAPAVGGVAVEPSAMLRCLLMRDSATSALALAALGWVSVLVVLAVFVLHLWRITAAYSRREVVMARMGSVPARPSEAEFFLAGHLRSGSWEHVDDVFAQWADWLGDIRATHTGYPALTCYRSATDRCWLDVAVLVLDAAALTQAVAPAWAPPSVRSTLEAGAACLPELARQIGIDLPRPAVSLQGREERCFEHTVRVAVVAGLPNQRDYTDAWAEFQRWRTRYAPDVSAMRTRLLYAEQDEYSGDDRGFVAGDGVIATP